MSAVSERVTLPLDVSPVHYSLELTPNLDKLEFFCNETVAVIVNRTDVSEISLHSKEIYVESVSFRSNAPNCTSNPSLTAIHYDVKYNIVKFVFDGPLPMGPGDLDIRYRGILNGDMCGFYKSQYTDVNGNKKIMASTQFEALDARR